MSVQLLFPPKWRSLDSNGNPLSGGLLYSYSAGTITPLATYTTRAGTVANANPVVLNANGEADVWGTPGVLYKLELRTSGGVVQWTVDNIPCASEADTTVDVAPDPGGRLSLTTATPVTTSDVSGAATVFYVPHKSNKVPVWDGSAWALYSVTTELSQTTSDNTKSPAAVAVSSNYDIFVWNDSGTLRATRGPAWTSDTARGTGAATTELERLDGRWVNKISISNGPAAQRGTYVGTVRSNASAQIDDSLASRHVWNMYNRTARPMRVTDSTDTWSYGTATTRQANASTANQLSVVRGFDEDEVFAMVNAYASIAVAGTSMAGVGLDSTTAFASNFVTANASLPVASNPFGIGGSWRGFPGLGRHYLAWLERGNGGTVTWYGDSGTPTLTQSGIHGTTWA